MLVVFPGFPSIGAPYNWDGLYKGWLFGPQWLRQLWFHRLVIKFAIATAMALRDKQLPHKAKLKLSITDVSRMFKSRLVILTQLTFA